MFLDPMEFLENMLEGHIYYISLDLIILKIPNNSVRVDVRTRPLEVSTYRQLSEQNQAFLESLSIYMSCEEGHVIQARRKN